MVLPVIHVREILVFLHFAFLLLLVAVDFRGFLEKFSDELLSHYIPLFWLRFCERNSIAHQFITSFPTLKGKFFNLFSTHLEAIETTVGGTYDFL